MRLAEYSLHCYRLRYERPVRWSDIIEEAAPFVLLRLQSDTGSVGVAEITVKPTWCGVTARSLMAMIEEAFLPLIATVDLDDPTKVRALLERIPENQAAKSEGTRLTVRLPIKPSSQLGAIPPAAASPEPTAEPQRVEDDADHLVARAPHPARKAL